MHSGRTDPAQWRIGAGARLLCALALVLAALVPLQSANAQPQSLNDRAPWRVLIIRSWDAQFPINQVRESALRTALLESAPRLIEIYTEEIDPVRLPGQWEQKLSEVLKLKYASTAIDVVVASGKEPLDYAARHRDELWPGAAIVFNGVIDGTLEGWQRPPRTTGLTMSFDVPGTIALGRALVPDARNVYVVAGTSEFERLYLDFALKQARSMNPPVELRPIVGLSRAETFARLGEIERNSLVFYLTVLRDADGRFSPPQSDMVTRVSASSRAPVLSAVQTQWHRGPVGGSASRLDVHGRAAGQLVRRVLEGADPDAIPVKLYPEPTCEIDWEALRHWEIAERLVPDRCEISNRPVTLLQAYFWPFVWITVLAVIEAGLIWTLWLENRSRRRAEAEAAARRAELAHVGRVSMMGALTASIAHEINQPMGAILSNADAAEMMLDKGTLDVEKLREILADIRSEDLRATEVIRGLRRMLARNEVKAVPLSVNAEVAEALRHVAYDAARKEVRFEPLFDSEVPSVLGDSVQLQQVVINLVLNAMDALSAMPPGEREIRIVTRAHAGGAEIAVKDRGPGIAPDEAARLLEAFHTTKGDGMGLGLAIVRAIVEMHGGRLTYEPNVPHGAVFRVWLPATGTGR